MTDVGLSGSRRTTLLALLAAASVSGCQDGDVGPDGQGVPAHLEVVAGAGQVGTVGTPLGQGVVVRVTDDSGRTVADVPVVFAAGEGAGSITPARATSGEDGQASAAWTLGPIAQQVTAAASVTGLAPVAISATARAGPVDAGRSSLAAAPESVGVGATSTLTVVARDAFGNPVAGATVHLDASGAANTLVQPAPTGRDGTAAGSLRATIPGVRTVLAVVDGTTLAGEATVTVDGAPAVGTVTVVPSGLLLVDGGTGALSAAVGDDRGNPIEDPSVAWRSDDDAVATVDGGGMVTARAPGTATITATSGGVSGIARVTVSLGEGSLIGVTYCTIGGVADRMDVYLPSDSKARPLPVAVHVHGGGWVSGSRSTGERFDELKQTLLDRGYLVASLDYRLAPAHKFPEQIEDVKCAIRHLRARASRYGLDPGRIGVWGGSAGGQLVALLGTADASAGFDDAGGFSGVSSRVQAVVAISAITDFTHPDELHDDYSREFPTWPDPASPEMIRASPVTHVSPEDAPFFFIVGEDDALVSPDQSARMHQRLQGAGVLSSLLRVGHADHDLEPTSAPTDPSAAVIVSRIAAFFDDRLR
jgi:acetyl esterase/lipase